MKNILLVDDEPKVTNLLVQHLQREGIHVYSAASGQTALTAALELNPDLIVLDRLLPDADGINILRRLRTDHATRHIPVIMLTDHSQIGDQITSLETGADDCVNKPFNPRELLLRIHAVLRRTQKVSVVFDLRIGPFHLDRRNLVVHLQGKTMDLTLTEYKLISHFLENPNVLHSRGELLSGVWGYHDDTITRTLDTHIRRLRQKLGRGDCIETVRGQGYQMNIALPVAA